jgi:hypothetical protein
MNAEIEFHTLFDMVPMDEAGLSFSATRRNHGGNYGYVSPYDYQGDLTIAVRYNGADGIEYLGERKTLSAALALFMRRWHKEA